MLHQREPATANACDDQISHAEYVEYGFKCAYGLPSDVACHVSHALHSLYQHAVVKRGTIPRPWAARIEQAVDDAEPDLLALFGAHPKRAFAARCLKTAKALAWHWADRSFGGDTICNDTRYVLWLRNWCHNFVLLEEIEEFHMRLAGEVRQARPDAPSVTSGIFDAVGEL